MNIKRCKLQSKYEELFQYKKNIDEMIKLSEHSVILNPQHLKIYLNNFISLLCEENIYFKFDPNGRTYELKTKAVKNNLKWVEIVEIFSDGTKEFWIEGSSDDLLAKYLFGELLVYER